MVQRIKSNLGDYVADQIRQKVASGIYAPGSKLPNEFELSDEYGVCRYTLREAIKKLTATGLVQVVRGRGTFVSELAPSNYVQSMMDVVILEQNSFAEVFEARLAIECATARLAACNATPQEFEHLKQIAEKMRVAMDTLDLDEYNELDLDFHNLIADISRNNILKHMLTFLQDIIKYTMDQSIVESHKGQRSMAGHDLILKAIANKDGQDAQNQMTEHLRYCQHLFVPAS